MLLSKKQKTEALPHDLDWLDFSFIVFDILTSCVHQCCVYLIKNTVITVILWNTIIIYIYKNSFLFECVFYSCKM